MAGVYFWTGLSGGGGLIEIISKFGRLEYGLRPEGWDGWAFRQQGGGAVTIPYTREPKGEFLVGLLKENRPNMGVKPVWCAMGGFVELSETSQQAQARESAEESGLDTTKATKLPGLNTTSDRLFFVVDAGADEGVRAYGLELPFDQLEMCDDSWKLKSSSVLSGIKPESELRFFTWRTAILLTSDSLARSAIAQLLTMVF